MKLMDTERERAGERFGRLLAPFVSMVSVARHARTFHPDGLVFAGRVTPISVDHRLAVMGQRLAGSALARFSAALWRGGFEHLDVLGVALRLRGEDITDAKARAGDQDLLFATIRSPLTMAIAPLTTNAHDFARNRYWAVSPFDVAPIGRVKFRLSPERQVARSFASREEKLLSAVESGRSAWRIEVRRAFSLGWTAVARLELERVANVDQETLRFSPFHCGRHIVPRGFVHAIRRPVYEAGQRARPHHEVQQSRLTEELP